MKTPYDVILKPVITEKSMMVTDAGKYTFKVAPESNKAEIKDAVEKLFGVKGYRRKHRELRRQG